MNARTPTVVACLAAATGLAGCAGGGSDRPDAATQSRYVPTTLPGGGMGLFVEGALASRRGDDERAVALLERATAAEPRLITAHRLLGELYLEDAQPAEAEAAFRRLVQLDPDAGRSHVRLAQALEALDRAEAALASYLQGVELEDDSFEGHLGAGRVLVELDRPGEALPYLDTATDLEPGSGEAWTIYATASDATGDLRAAEAAYGRAIELVPEQDGRRLELLLAAGRAAARAGDQALARDRFARARELAPGDPRPAKLLAALAVAEAERLNAAGDEDAAISAFRDALAALDDAAAVAGEDADVAAARGSAYLRLWQLGGEIDRGLLDAALAAWRRSLALDPAQPGVAAAIERFGR